MTHQSAALVGLAAVVSFLLGLVAASTRPPLPHHTPPVFPGEAAADPVRIRAGAPPVALGRAPVGSAVDFAAVAATVNAAVVNVDTAFRGADAPTPGVRRYSTDGVGAPREASGSGFIIDPAGYVLTNHHVANGADRVTVTLGDGRSFRADIVGLDPAIDVALLQVHASEPLPAVTLGDSHALRVGEWVCAIGNPLGVYVHSVTVGVVSFLGRRIFDESLAAYIQTDAAISVGNSGGPLINARGEVVGITTAVSAQAPNIGFAIPMAEVIAVLPQLRARGTVARGDIGLVLTSVTPGLQRALGLGPERGALVQDVPPGTAADRAGLRPYDVVVAMDGEPVGSDEDLARLVASRLPGIVATLDVWRDGEIRPMPVKLSVRQMLSAGRVSPQLDDARPVARQEAPLGLRVRDLDDLAAGLRIPPSIRGVLVTEVDPAGPARLAQVRGNQVIMEINRRPVRSVAEYRAVVATLRPGDVAALLVYDKTTHQRSICAVELDQYP
jgi:serine protease Do